MAYVKLKKMLMKMDLEDDVAFNNLYNSQISQVEVLADSVQQALAMAATELNLGMDELDYEILKKGNSGLFGFGRMPYRIKVHKMQDFNRYADIEDLNISLDGMQNTAGAEKVPEVKDGKGVVRSYKEGVFVKIKPPEGGGQPVASATVHDKIQRAGVFTYSKNLVEKALKNPSDEFVKIADAIPSADPSVDSSASIEVSPDEMQAIITLTAPRPTGKHLKTKEVVAMLQSSGITYGIDESVIEDALEDDKYYQPVVAAEGDKPVDGEDGVVTYKVRIEKKVEFEEDEQGKIDFYAKDLIENVVEGQVLAERSAPGEGKNGKTVTGKETPAKDGKMAEFKFGKGVVLSNDDMQLLAEYNGQVIFSVGRISVEEVLRVDGDVGLTTGNITFLGSVIVRGSVTDNMEVKAAGNIEVATSVEKAHMEAEGDIIIRQGIQGRDEGFIESTAGSVFFKFAQNVKIHAEKDVIADEAILHSHVSSNGSVICKGKRAQIVGGEILAGKEVRVKQLGAQSSTPTSIIVGTSPKLLKQLKDLEDAETVGMDKMDKLQKNIRALTLQKTTQRENFPIEKEDILSKMVIAEEKQHVHLNELGKDKQQLTEYIEKLAKGGKVHVEKTLFPGVRIEINGAILDIRDEYSHITLVEENKMIQIKPFEPAKKSDKFNKRKRR